MKHKYMLLKIRGLIKFLAFYLKSHFLINGLSIKIKGKIALGGNAKKKRTSIKAGTISNTRKNTKITTKSFIIRTPTGVLGVNLKLEY